MSDPAPAERPVLRILQGDPTPDELAALIAVLAGRRGRMTTSGPSRSATSAWGAYWRTARAPVRPGPGAWRASALPR